MKNQNLTRLVSVLVLAAATTAFAEPEARKDIMIHRGTATVAGPQFHSNMPPPEMEKVAFLGVETAPVDATVAAQLGLPQGTGVVVRRVADGSPADGLLKPHDVLTKLDDQILVNMPQLTVLVRNHMTGDEVKLTLRRAGKEMTVKAKLAEHEVPKLAWAGAITAPAMQFFGQGGPMGMSGQGGITVSSVPGMPMMEGADPGDVMRAIGGDRMNWFAGPRVHVFKGPGGHGRTILDLPAGNFVFSDDQGSLEVNTSKGKRELTVKAKDGKVTFQGPINTPEERKMLPTEVKERLDEISRAELGDDADELEVETKVFRPAIKTRRVLPQEGAPEAGMRSL